MKAVAIVLASAALAGCASSDRDPEPGTYRFVGEPGEAYSFSIGDEWRWKRDRGAVIFHAPDGSRRTLAVRSLPRTRDNTGASAVDATGVVLGGLPGVTITSERAVTSPLPGHAYELTFQPPNARGRYARRHVVLVGDEHVFHVIETAPVAASSATTAIDTVISTFREEV